MLGICSLSVLVLHESLLAPVLMNDNQRMLWRMKERSGVRNVKMVNLRGLLRRVPKGMDERIDEDIVHVLAMRSEWRITELLSMSI